MERRSCCTGSYAASPCMVTQKKEPKKEDVKPEVTKKEAGQEAKGIPAYGTGEVLKSPKSTEEKQSVAVKKEEPVKVNVGCGGGCGSYK